MAVIDYMKAQGDGILFTTRPSRQEKYLQNPLDAAFRIGYYSPRLWRTGIAKAGVLKKSRVPIDRDGECVV